MTHEIASYALLSDCRSAALVSANGSIDWWCPSRFDGPACFTALLGEAGHGHFSLSPVSLDMTSGRRYDGESLVLITTHSGVRGTVQVIDAMLLGQAKSTIMRRVQGIEGTVDMTVSFLPIFAYGRAKPWVTVTPEGAIAIAGSEALSIQTPVPLSWSGHAGHATFKVGAGQTFDFVIRDIDPFATDAAPLPDIADALNRTRRDWIEWATACTYQGPYRDAVVRSLLTLKALTYGPTGGIVAAATTSLPEELGGSRNWDYRFCWLRDAAVTLLALLRTGMRDEAAAWLRWLLVVAAGDPEDLQIMYGVGGERRLPETELDWLPGYDGARPVRIGNAASTQTQLDVYGEVAAAIYEAARAGVTVSDDAWRLHCELLEHLAGVWENPDDGMWEVRGGARHFLHSKVMSWVAFDRAIKTAALTGRDAPVQRWAELRDVIHEDLCTRGFDEELEAFVQSYGSKEVDATALLMPLLDVLPADDVRVRSTTDLVESVLREGDLVYRYRPRETVEGVRGSEAAFVACSFWLVSNLARRGDLREACGLFERMLARRNDVGLLSEEMDAATGRMLGNFPQAYSQVALILAADTIAAVTGAPTPPEQAAAAA